MTDTDRDAIKKTYDIKSSEITQGTYLNRRLFMRGAILAGSALGTGLLYRKLNPPPAVVEERAKIANILTQPSEDAMRRGFNVNEARTSFADITNYNNFYEFSTDKSEVAVEAKDFVTRPWTVSVEGQSTSQRHSIWTIC
jgi:sulfoxide reductase catalytic subunit YedY